ncbi:MAG: mechanosensitive ion channel [Bdellovibrionales bacterium]|nr:mechanosensitive ion channel [Bdellovibrionales bacterium]
MEYGGDLSDKLNELWLLLQRPLFTLDKAKVSSLSIIFSIFAVWFAWKISIVLGRLASKWLSGKNVDSGVRDSIEKFIRYSVFLVGLMMALDNMGFSISSLAAVGAVLMVGIGFGLQNLTQNFISGIILLIERPIKVGDIIRVGSTSGRIVDIRVRSTIVQTRDDITIIVPNSKLISEEVINDSYSGKTIRQHLRVGVSYSSNIENVQRILCEAALRHSKVLKDPPPVAIFQDFGESSLDFDLRFFSSEIWTIDVVTGEIRSAILSELRKANIEIPFPQRDIHLKQPVNSD